MPATRHPWLATATAWLALLVLGFPGSLVVCSGPHCAAKIEIAHPSGSCCEAGHDDGAPTDAGTTACEDHGCDDLVLGISTGPLPERVSFDHREPPTVATPAVGVAHGLGDDAGVPRPPTTGPPRVDRRTGLLASTVLLL